MSELTLTRSIGETLLIGNDISITLLQRGGNQVRLRISAPKSVIIRRAELNNATCPGCDKAFVKNRKDQRFCSDKCRSKDYMRRWRAARASK